MAEGSLDRVLFLTQEARRHARLAAVAAAGGNSTIAAWEADFSDSYAFEAHENYAAIATTGSRIDTVDAALAVRDAWSAFTRAASSAMEAWAAEHSRGLNRLRFTIATASQLLEGSASEPPSNDDMTDWSPRAVFHMLVQEK